MGRLIHCLGMFIRDMENKKQKRKSQPYDEQQEIDRVAKLVLYYGILISVIGFIAIELF